MTDNSSSAGQRGRARPRFRVGSAPDSWGVWFPDDPRQTPWSRFLDEIARAGYEWLELGPHGYLPADANARRASLRELESASRRLQQTQVFIETPYRNAAMLDAALEVLQPATRLAISCGLTLPDGWSLCRTAAQWKAAKAQLPDRVPAVFSLLGLGARPLRDRHEFPDDALLFYAGFFAQRHRPAVVLEALLRASPGALTPEQLLYQAWD